MSSDPLSFFAGDASSSSESEEEEENVEESREEERYEEGEADRLPSPNTLFATVGRPSFLRDPQEQRIDWDQFVKNPEPSSDADANPHSSASGQYTAIPPPTSLNEDPKSGTILGSTNSAEISVPPVMYGSQSEKEPGNSTVSTAGDSTVKVGTKRPNMVDETAGESSKKSKGETFRQKEKRKRDLGQTSRGKSYVEEEKRILRQCFGKDDQ